MPKQLGIAAGFFLGFILLQLPYLSYRLPYDYDEGVYWQTLVLLQDGHRLYTDIFYSQWPVFLEGLRFILRSGVESIALSRGAVVVLSAFFPAAVYGIARKLGAGSWALLFGLLALGNSQFFHLGHQLKGDAPAVAFLALAFLAALPDREGRQSGFAVLVSAIFFFLALQMKLVVAPAALPLLWILSFPARKFSSAALFLGVSVGLTVASLWALGWWPAGLSQWQGGAFLAQFRAEGELIPGTSLFEKIVFFFENHSEREASNLLTPVLGLFSLMALGFLSRKKGVFLGAIFLLFALVLLKNKVVFAPHLTVFSFLFVISLGLVTRELSKQLHPWRKLWWALIAAVVIWDFAAYGLRIRDFPRLTTRQQEEARIAEVIEKEVPAGALFLAHHPFLSTLSLKRSPPFFADTSEVRMRMGNLRCEDYETALRDPQVRGVSLGPKTKFIDCGDQILRQRLKEKFGLREVHEGREIILIR